MIDTGYRWEMVEPAAPLMRKDFKPSISNPNEVTVEIQGCGVCHTDLGYYYGEVKPNHDLPLTLGHEISGRIVETGSKAGEMLGAAVLVYAVIPCGECELCRKGFERICQLQKMPGNDIQGGFSTHITVPANGVCLIDEEKLTKSGLALGDLSVVADAVTTPFQAVVNSEIQDGDLAIVVGVGGVGGYAVQIAKAFGATVVAIDIDDAKLEKIASFGAEKIYNAKELEGYQLKKEIDRYSNEQKLPAAGRKIFECSGTAAGQKTAFDLLSIGAKLCVVGFTMDKVELRLSKLMALDATAIGNWGCSTALYPEAIDLVLDKKIALTPFIESHALDDINEIFEQVHHDKFDRRVILSP